MATASIPATLLLVLGAARAQAPWSVEQMTSDLDQIAAAVRASWSYADDRRENSGVDVDALRDAAKSALAAVRSADDFALVVRRFTAGLQDGHAWSFVPGEAALPARHLPFLLVDCAEGLVVTAAATGLERPRNGDRLVALGSEDVGACLTRLEREVFASTPGMRRALAVERMLRCSAERAACTFADSEGVAYAVELVTRTDDEAPRALQPENWSLSWPRPGIGMLHLSSFTVPRWKEWRAARHEEREPFLVEGRARIDAVVAELAAKQAAALIIDLRGNRGGTDLLAIHLAERLLAGPFVYTKLSAFVENAWLTPDGMTFGKGDHARFSGPLALLADSHSFSATDNFLRCLHDLHPRCTVIGRPSGAGTGAPRELVVAKHSRAVVGACSMRVFGPRGELIEGRGTRPDVGVRWTQRDVVRGTDPDVEAALSRLTK